MELSGGGLALTGPVRAHAAGAEPALRTVISKRNNNGSFDLPEERILHLGLPTTTETITSTNVPDIPVQTS